jgi:hypothetical protein
LPNFVYVEHTSTEHTVDHLPEYVRSSTTSETAIGQGLEDGKRRSGEVDFRLLILEEYCQTASYQRRVRLSERENIRE